MEFIPVIDFTNLSTKNERVPSLENWRSVAAELDRALSTIGFAYIINHDVDQGKVYRIRKKLILYEAFIQLF